MVPVKVLCRDALVSFIFAISPVWFLRWTDDDIGGSVVDVIDDVTAVVVAVVEMVDKASDPGWGDEARGDQISWKKCPENNELGSNN